MSLDRPIDWFEKFTDFTFESVSSVYTRFLGYNNFVDFMIVTVLKLSITLTVSNICHQHRLRHILAACFVLSIPISEVRDFRKCGRGRSTAGPCPPISDLRNISLIVSLVS